MKKINEFFFGLGWKIRYFLSDILVATRSKSSAKTNFDFINDPTWSNMRGNIYHVDRSDH